MEQNIENKRLKREERNTYQLKLYNIAVAAFLYSGYIK